MAQPLPERQFVSFLLLGSVISLCVLVTHWPALDARALAFDDGEYLVSNRLVQDPSLSSAAQFLTEVTRPSTVRGYYQPLTMISLMLDSALGGSPENLRPFHRTSLALHTANTLLILLLLDLLFGHWPAAALVALLFGVHPLTVEPIPWVGERKTLLAAFFALISLVCYALQARREAAATAAGSGSHSEGHAHGEHHQSKHHHHDGHKHPHAHTLAAVRKAETAARRSWQAWALYAGCILGYLCAVLSKPTAIPLPVVMLLLDFWPLKRLSARSALDKSPLLAIGMLSAIVTYISQDRSASTFDPGQLSPFRGLFNVCHNLVFYPAKMLWPANLSPHYPFPQPFDLTNLHVLFGVIGTLLLAALVILSLRRGRPAFTGAMIFFFALLPTTGIVGFTNVVASDKYAYLPAVGVLVVLAWLARRLWDSRPPRAALPVRVAIVGTTAAAALAFACVSRADLAHWRDTRTLYGHALSLAPDSYILHHNYALSLKDTGHRAEAIAEYRRALELNPTYTDTYFNLGIALDEDGRKEEAVAAFRRALELNPRDAKTHNNLGNVLVALGRTPEALSEYQQAVESDPTLIPAQTNFANSLLQSGRVDEAIAHYRQAIAQDPSCVGAHNNLGIALFKKGSTDEAIREYEATLRLKPNAPCENNLGIALAKRGRFEDSVRHYRAALRLQPKYPDALSNLGTALLTLGRTEEAADVFRQALQLNPTDKKARSGLALLAQARSDKPTLTGAALSTRPE